MAPSPPADLGLPGKDVGRGRNAKKKKGRGDDIKDGYAEAKAVGYDAKIMRQIVRLRKMKPDDRAEMEAILDTYKAALGLG